MAYGQLATQEYIERKFAEVARQRQTQFLVLIFTLLAASGVVTAVFALPL